MAPSAISDILPDNQETSLSLHKASNGHINVSGGIKRNLHLTRDLKKSFPIVTRGKGNFLTLEDGSIILDAAGGAAVSCLGHGNQRVIDAITRQLMTGSTYLCSSIWTSNTVNELCEELINGTQGAMSKVYLTGSGSEAMEASVKLSRQFFYEQDKNTPRVNFIARENSYHGITIGALGVSGHKARRAPFEPFLMNVHRVSACNAYRQQTNESNESFVAQKAAELEAKFQELGPDTVVAFVCEPVVGAALGCVPYVPGYLKAMRDVCHRHGALFILDEVMSGMGRCGTLHAWQEEGVAPDLQTVGKGLAGGYQPIAAVFISQKIVNGLHSGKFVHGQTYQAMPVQAAAALEVQRIMREDKLVENVRIQGKYLGQCLKEYLGKHPNVGDIRGKGLFWGIEFVQDKRTKEPFDPRRCVAQVVHDTAISDFKIALYLGTGTVDGTKGDHVIIAPTYISTREDIECIAKTVAAVVNHVFSQKILL
ncbi:hypothetical protein HYALB_00003978 [Hymenoscyphus albidus]|uniref:Aminotransferase n=1 Tax=Hymenoscyphus albidus TaxID=595503 RepID=A0A9N9PZF0_9HELO|nr:hypothetical protein HYALB_00003978 [Hymenoscyphus albidus]